MGLGRRWRTSQSGSLRRGCPPKRRFVMSVAPESLSTALTIFVLLRTGRKGSTATRASSGICLKASTICRDACVRRGGARTLGTRPLLALLRDGARRRSAAGAAHLVQLVLHLIQLPLLGSHLPRQRRDGR